MPSRTLLLFGLRLAHKKQSGLHAQFRGAVGEVPQSFRRAVRMRSKALWDPTNLPTTANAPAIASVTAT